MALNADSVLLIQTYNTVYVYLLVTLIVMSTVFFFIALNYCNKLKKVAEEKRAMDNANFDISQQFNSLINSLNDIIFEFNEDKVCLNVWFNDNTERVVDPRQTVGKTLYQVLGAERAKKFDDAMDYVIANRQPTSLEYISDYGTGEWFLAKLSPVFDRDGNYASRISASLTNISQQHKYAEALKANEQLLTEAQSIAKTSNWWYDYSTSETYWSTYVYSILEIDELPAGANKFEHYMKLVHNDDREKLSQYLYAIKIQEDEINYEHRIVTPNGNLKYIKILKGKTENINDETSQRISGIIQDITDTKLYERALKLSRTELIEAQTIAKIGNWKLSTSAKKIEWSDEIKNIFELDQLSTNVFEGTKLLSKYVDKHDRFILQHLLKSITQIGNYTCVLRVNTPSGKVKYVRIIIGKLLKRDDGSIRKIIGTLQDITDRKQAEIDYKRTENKYKTVLETIKLAALSLDKHGRVTFCNQYLANLLGYEPRDIIGIKCTDFIPEPSRSIIADWFANNMFEPQHINPIICKNGEQRVISWQNTVSYDENGQVKETTSIGEDITDQQRITQELITAKEIAEKSSEFKSEFLSIMSHEIRTPMNAVIGTTNLLMSEDPKPEQLEYLNILKFSADNLLAIINDILDYNKIEAGKLELNITQFNIYQLTQKIKKSFYSKALEKLLEIDVQIDPAIPELILGDQMRLSQVLNNLIGNAVKFTQKGKVTLALEAGEINNDQVTIKFKVTDTGIGIAAENLRMIFDPFTQESQYNNQGGTGLGLAITKRLVELHDSDIQVVSELGKGTQFTFLISFQLPEPSKISPVIEKDGIMLNLLGMNILLVDDNRMNVIIAAKFLKKWQANVDEAENGQIAVDMVNAKPYDVIIMDLQMPVMDGFEATKLIKATHPHIPVIALTADAMPETYAKALAIGMSDYLTKPFVPGVFFEKISKFYKPAL